jgi:hypothetical protein
VRFGSFLNVNARTPLGPNGIKYGNFWVFGDRPQDIFGTLDIPDGVQNRLADAVRVLGSTFILAVIFWCNIGSPLSFVSRLQLDLNTRYLRRTPPR